MQQSLAIAEVDAGWRLTGHGHHPETTDLLASCDNIFLPLPSIHHPPRHLSITPSAGKIPILASP